MAKTSSNNPLQKIVRKASGVRVRNTLTNGAGANTMQDRGALSRPAMASLNPYYNNNYYWRWQSYTTLYYTSWEARKIVEIPINDAFRIRPQFNGIEEAEKMALLKQCDKLQVFEKFKRAAIQERLLGGSAVLIGLAEDHDDPEKPIDYKKIEKGDLKFINIVSVNQITNPEYDTDPFSPGYDKPKFYQINGIKTHTSRLIIFDGEPLFNYSTQRLMQNFRINPQGFGESVLVPLWDAIMRCIGTQQAAYQLVQKASITLVKAEQLLNLEGTKKGDEAIQKLEEMAEMVSIYRAAILKGKGIEIEESGASFGSVPELVMSFIQTLSAGSDVPASRFIGQAPGGLNATGEGDLENYYNNIASYQTTRLSPKYEKLFEILGRSALGSEKWEEVRKTFEIEFESLWNLKGTEKSQVDETYIRVLNELADKGIVSKETVVKEINARRIFLTELSEDEIQDMPDGFDYTNSPDNVSEEADKKIGELLNGGNNPE